MGKISRPLRLAAVATVAVAALGAGIGIGQASGGAGREDRARAATERVAQQRLAVARRTVRIRALLQEAHGRSAVVVLERTAQRASEVRPPARRRRA